MKFIKFGFDQQNIENPIAANYYIRLDDVKVLGICLDFVLNGWVLEVTLSDGCTREIFKSKEAAQTRLDELLAILNANE